MKLESFRKYLRNRKQKGQSLVEFALVVPVLLILFMGMCDFGWVLHQQIQMDNATRLGGRRGAVGETNTVIIQRMQATCSFNLPTNQITIEVRNPQGVNTGNNNDRTPDNLIWVSINRTVNLVTPLGNFIAEAAGPFQLHSEAEFLIE
jgi:Flp pilus assembly protein TadG